VVLFDHQHEAPVGTALWIKRDKAGLVMKSKHPRRPDDLHPSTPFRPDDVFALMSCGPPTLTGASVGFIALEVRDLTPEERQEFPGVERVIAKSMLLEVSMVAIPCNPEALMVAVTKGLIKFKKVGHVKLRPAPAPARKVARLAPVSIDADAVARRVAERYMGKI
jgi:phage head maturation protease